MGEQFLILAATLVFGYGLFSALAAKSVVTPPMAFMGVGLLLGSGVLGLVELDYQSSQVELLATIALIIILCADASQIDRRAIRKVAALPVRLLVIGLPLTMAAGVGVGVLQFPGVELAAVALLAVLLSPTDAALGQAVITNEAVPEGIREALNVESGLNDGIALPPVFALLFVLGADLGGTQTDDWLEFLAMQLMLGPVAGVILGGGGGRLLERAAERGWVDPGFQRLAMPAMALLAYALAEAIGGNGFIAAFVSGFSLGVRTESVRRNMQSFSETEGTLLSLLVFLILGLVLIPAAVPHWDLRTTVYALLSLTVVRMLPVAISVAGLGLDWRSVLFLGWFGPRGISSVLYLLLFVRYLGTSGYERVIATGVETVVLSVLLHGLTAAPWAQRYGRWKQAHPSS